LGKIIGLALLMQDNKGGMVLARMSGKSWQL
jgi:hypothetical protein